MGCFDSVYANCPNCGAEHEFQSKSGECLLYSYSLEDCPEDILSDVNRHSPVTCDCGVDLEIDKGSRQVLIC